MYVILANDWALGFTPGMTGHFGYRIFQKILKRQKGTLIIQNTITYFTEKYKTSIGSIGSILYSFPYTFLLTTTILVAGELEFKKYSDGY